MAPPDTTLEPRGLLDKSGKFSLDRTEITSLMTYVWTGVLLATTETEYQKRVVMTADRYNKLRTELDPLLEDYKLIKTHCSNFKDKTYPALIAIASAIYDYAQNASGSDDTSYYAIILSSTQLLIEEGNKPENKQNPATIDQLKGILNELIDEQVEKIKKLVDDAGKVTKALSDFQQEALQDSTKLEAHTLALTNKISVKDAQVKTLDIKVQKERDEIIENDNKEENGRNNMIIGGLSVLIFPLGAIILTRGAVCIKNAKAKAAVVTLNTLINEQTATIKTGRLIITDANSAKSDLKKVSDALSKAIPIIGHMVGQWKAIEGDLENVKRFVNDNVRGAGKFTAALRKNQTVAKWNDLKIAVDKYRQGAFVVTVPQVTTLEEFAKKLAAEK